MDNPEGRQLLKLMREYVALADKLPHAQTLKELTELLAELDDAEDAINAMAEEPEVRLH